MHNDSIKIDNKISFIKISEINIMDKLSVGGTIHKDEFTYAFTKPKFKVFNNGKVEKEQLEEEKEPEVKKGENLTMSDFFDDFKI